jgi:hypothetical protein
VIDNDALNKAFQEVAEETLKRDIREWVVYTAPKSVIDIMKRYEELLKEKENE